MISISAKIREVFGKKVKDLREQGILPAILYGQKAKETALSLELKEFKKVFQSAGESSLITLDIEGRKE
ncbi:MAG: 50S ribosomal protein L25, partial [Patescibacteria group bacterium]